MANLLESYAQIVGNEVIDHLRQLAEPLKGMKVVHVNSTREGGGVAEILNWLVPLKKELGLNAEWEVITGEKEFYQCTKSFHNALQGDSVEIPPALLRIYEKTNEENAERMRGQLEDADFVFIHDPQPAPLLKLCPDRKGKWIWRCHIDLSRPYRAVWKYLRDFVVGYDASVWSLADFAQPLPHPLYLIAPSIDPLSQKNRELFPGEVNAVFDRWGLDPDKPLITQVSRFDRFKDPVGVIHAYRQVKEFTSVQLVLAGGGATDDPEGEEVLKEVRNAAGDDPDIHILLLPSDAHREINALQRASTICLQKSTKEGFGLTVTEAMWKGKPVIGGDTGGIRLQVINHHTGFLVNTPEGAALRVRYLLKKRDKLEEMGRKAKDLVLNNFLVTRHLREYLTLMFAIMYESVERIEL
ncbi:glycosyltransferase [Desulforhabdus amnigena]|uniref:Glycosyl transferase family 1 n=1 Tax=Desulforhabdus amnigena TaxID=40218 RepID=A0A9W6CXG0_9BACT|nr:glycosyltransferase [Desulforhabdus amnigena]GLI34409.1 glycosyl transferase family 1 [Desulforhabdus amnigena]